MGSSSGIGSFLGPLLGLGAVALAAPTGGASLGMYALGSGMGLAAGSSFDQANAQRRAAEQALRTQSGQDQLSYDSWLKDLGERQRQFNETMAYNYASQEMQAQFQRDNMALQAAGMSANFKLSGAQANYAADWNEAELGRYTAADKPFKESRLKNLGEFNESMMTLKGYVSGEKDITKSKAAMTREAGAREMLKATFGGQDESGAFAKASMRYGSDLAAMNRAEAFGEQQQLITNFGTAAYARSPIRQPHFMAGAARGNFDFNWGGAGCGAGGNGCGNRPTPGPKDIFGRDYNDPNYGTGIGTKGKKDIFGRWPNDPNYGTGIGTKGK